MVEKFQTSFIPKKVEEVGGTRKKRKASMSILMLGGVLIFLVASLATAGVFFYKQILERRVVSKEEALARAQEAFEPSLIRELVRLDNRITVSNRLLNEHIAPSSIFGLLESTTLESVRFTNFDFDESVENDDKIELTMKGTANSFDAVALQSDEFAKNIYIQEPIFSGLSVTASGDVGFSVVTFIDRGILKYGPPTLEVEELEENDDVSLPEDGDEIKDVTEEDIPIDQ